MSASVRCQSARYSRQPVETRTAGATARRREGLTSSVRGRGRRGASCTTTQGPAAAVRSNPRCPRRSARASRNRPGSRTGSPSMRTPACPSPRQRAGAQAAGWPASSIASDTRMRGSPARGGWVRAGCAPSDAASSRSGPSAWSPRRLANALCGIRCCIPDARPRDRGQCVHLTQPGARDGALDAAITAARLGDGDGAPKTAVIG